MAGNARGKERHSLAVCTALAGWVENGGSSRPLSDKASLQAF